MLGRVESLTYGILGEINMAVCNFWEKPKDELDYYEKLRRGICPECNSEGCLIVEVSYEYVRRRFYARTQYASQFDQEVKSYFTVIRCQKCKKPWLPSVLLP